MDISYYDEFLKNKGLAESTRHTFCSVVQRFLSTNPNIDETQPYIDFIIETAIKKRGYSNIYALSHYVNWKFDNNKKLAAEIIAGMRDRKTKMHDPKRYLHIRPLSDEEIEKTIDNLGSEKHKVMCYLIYHTGIRIGDALHISKEGIVWEQVNNQSVLTLNLIAKGEKQRTISITDQTLAKMIFDFVSTHDYKTGYAFMEPRKNTRNTLAANESEFGIHTINYLKCWKDLKRALVYAGIDPKRFASHGFRRKFARRFYDNTHDLELLKGLMGHRDINTTARYLTDYSKTTKEQWVDYWNLMDRKIKEKEQQTQR